MHPRPAARRQVQGNGHHPAHLALGTTLDAKELIMYEPGTLRPPTAADMARRELALEHIKIEHSVFCFPEPDPVLRAELETYGAPTYYCAADRHLEDVSLTTVADLIALHQGYGIPYDATISSVGYEGELGLFWGHLMQCDECDGWYFTGRDEHRATDYHAAVVMGRNAPLPVLGDEQLRALGRPVPGDEPAVVTPRQAAELMAHFTAPPVDGLGPC